MSETILPPPARDDVDLKAPSLYINRELGWVDFNARVLEEALDESNPLLERVKFLAIFSNNLDEFFMIRVAGLRQQVAAGVTKTPADGMSPGEQLDAIREKLLPLQTLQRQCWSEDIKPALAEYGVHILRSYEELQASEQDAVRQYFRAEIFPVLTPLAVDPGRPFPHISNLSLNLAINLRDHEGEARFARLKVPSGVHIPRFLNVSDIMERYGAKPLRSPHVYLYLSEVIRANLDLLFPGMSIEDAYRFRVTRDADVEIAEDEASDLLETIEQGVRLRRFGQVVRLTVEKSMPNAMCNILMRHLDVTERDVYKIDGPLGLADLFQIASIDIPELKYPNFVPRQTDSLLPPNDIFSVMRQRDFLLHHPYDSFTPTVSFIRSAAHDPEVLAIKITLYRVGNDSPIVQALLEAMEKGKQIAVLVELKARFDEQNNIVWARALEAHGVHVVYGLVGLKTHAKVALVVRRERNTLRRYVHMSTGNYNADTARLYTDLGFMTSDPEITDDATELFNRLTGYAPSTSYKKLMVAPERLRGQLEALIDREIAHAQAGQPGHIIIKSNSLTDAKMIRKLYEASRTGVKIDAIIRGICCLRPGIPGVSENIHVRSIVGRFLEHSRVFWFGNNGRPEVFVGSADLMDRNLNRRVETIFPIESENIRTELHESLLKIQLADNVRARVLQSDGTWQRLSPAEGEKPLDSQEWAIKYSRATRL
ncbi:MAG: polyphosphate kinase 1 [Chloroflexi bacterium]|nr:polyphosphate kinase 1 [Chloroflexota bacterium]